MQIDSRFLGNTQHQILAEIMNTLNLMPNPFTPWISLPPYSDTKTDLLYEIWQKLAAGGGGGGGSDPGFIDIALVTDGAYTIPAGNAIHKLYFLSTVNETVTIGSTTDNTLYAPGFDLQAGVMLGLTIDILSQANKTVKFYGILNQTAIRIYLHKI